MDGTDVVVKPSPPRHDQNRFEATPPLRRSGRQTQLPIRYRETDFITSMLSVVEPSEWMASMEEEYESILKNKTWDLVELP